VEYHRGVRKTAGLRSELDEIPGIGEKRRNALLMKFGSIEGIKSATEEELAATPGMNAVAARWLLDYYRDAKR
jgi:excinuclease ABC subunit C